MFLHGAILNAEDQAQFLHRKESPKASEILIDTISKFRYMPHVMSLEKVSMSESMKRSEWHSKATWFRPIAHILVVCILNNLSMYQLYNKLLGALIMHPFIKYPYNSILKHYLRYFLKASIIL